MRNRNISDEDDYSYDYSPNELAELSQRHYAKYREIVESNLDRDDTVERWEQRNLERMQKFLHNRVVGD